MVAELLADRLPAQEFSALLRPEPLPGDKDPEERLTICGLSWRRYLDLDQALGDDRPGPRLYYSYALSLLFCCANKRFGYIDCHPRLLNSRPEKTI